LWGWRVFVGQAWNGKFEEKSFREGEEVGDVGEKGKGEKRGEGEGVGEREKQRDIYGEVVREVEEHWGNGGALKRGDQVWSSVLLRVRVGGGVRGLEAC
jgi:hypothetical protein